MDKSIRVDTVLGALDDVLPLRGWSDEVQVFRLEVDCACRGDTFWIQPIRATPAEKRGSGRAAANGEEDCEADERSSGSDASASEVVHASADKLSDLSASDKDYFELCSSDDSDVEAVPELPAKETVKEGKAAAADEPASDSEDEEAAQGPRAAQHTHTVWQNDYFVLTDNRNFPSVRMSVKERWKGDAFLGRPCGSKTLVPHHFGDDRNEPDQVFIALRAWMLHRWRGNNGRFLEHPCRLRVWQRELAALQADIKGRSKEAALGALTLLRVREWAPEALS